MTSVFDFVRNRVKYPELQEEEETAEEEKAPKNESIFDVVRSRPKKFSPEPSTIQKIASSVPSQAALGTFKRFTYPLDLIKMAALGEGLSGVDELEEIAEREGVAFDRQDYLRKVFQAAEALPTQDLAEKFIQEKTGLNLAPQGKFGKFARKTGELFGLTSKLGQGTTQLGKSAAGSATGATVSEGLQELGVPEFIADAPAYGIAGGARTGKIEPRELKGEPLKARETAEKFNLQKIAGIEREAAPKIPPVVSASRQKKVTEGLGKTSKKAVEKIIESKLPIKTLQKQGYDLEQIYTKSYDMARSRAKSHPSNVNIDPVREWISKEHNRITKHAISPSSSDKVALKILEDEWDVLNGLNAKGSKTAISTKAVPTAEQVLNQFHKYNENVKGIYKKPEFSGAEDEIRRVYRELNEKLVESLEKSGRQDVMVPFRVANKAYHETAKLNQVEEILGKAFDQGYSSKKLKSIVDNKRSRKFLERSLGKETINDLKDIASYGQRAEEMVLKKLKNPKTVGQYFSELTPMKAALLLFKHGALGPAAVPYELGKGAIQRIQGLLFTNASTTKAYKEFLKGVAEGTPSALRSGSQKLTKAIEKEFGSEEELLRLAEMEKEEESKV